jgi:NADH dehydrogenase
VHLNNSEIIASGTVICTIGTEPNPIVQSFPIEKERGRIRTNEDMSIPGQPGLWAIGDCAAVPNAAANGSFAPPTAQFADRQARQLADNIVASLAGKPTRPFSYTPTGALSSIGHKNAVAELFGLRLSGFVAWLLWRGVYLLKIPTFARKVRLWLEWSWGMFFPPDIAHFGFRRTRRQTIAPPEVAKRVASA